MQQRAGRRRRLVLLGCLVLAAAAPGSAGADSSADEAEARFRHGADLYRVGRYEEALLEFFTSNRLAPNRNVVFNIARSFEALGRYDEAYRYYRDNLAALPAGDERTAAERKLAELGPRVALLAVASTPPGATVYIDRKDLGGRGETPLTLALPPGAHAVILELAGHEPSTQAVTLTRGARVDLAPRLALVVGNVRVSSRPPAELRVDRPEDDAAKPDASTPATLALPPGKHVLELRAAGHRPLRRLIDLGAHDDQNLDLALEPLPPDSGTLALAGAERGAAVAIDGVPYGVLPLVSTLAVGTHRVTVTQEGCEPWQREIVVGRDSHAFIEVELVEREPEVVGAMRLAQRVGDAPASVSLLGAGELRAFGYETVADALRAVRGLYESDDHTYHAVGIRGFSRPGDYTNRVLVMRDGHTINDALVGSGFVGRDLAPDLEDVARIEVVRGPGSTFYGQGAFFGAINVVSLAPGEGPRLSAGATLLSDGGSRAHARGRASWDGGEAALSASAFGSSGQTLFFDDFRGTPSGGFARDADGENAQRGALRLRQGSFALDAEVVRRKKEIPTASFETVFDPAHADGSGGAGESVVDQRGALEARFERRFLLVRAFGDVADYEGRYPYDDPGGKFLLRDGGRAFSGGGEARVSFDTGPWNRLTLGAQAEAHRVHFLVDTDTGDTTFDDRRTLASVAGYGVTELDLGSRLRVTAGARVDRLGAGGDLVFTSRTAAVLRPYERGRTKLVLGQAYRAPTPYEQYYSDGGVTQMAAPPLDPETIDTAEIEHTHAPGSRASLTVSLFASRLRHLIGLVVDPGSSLLVYRNSDAELRTVGAEAEARVRLAQTAWLQGALSFTHLSGGEDAERTNSPALTGFVRALWVASRDATLAGELLYNSPRQDRAGADTAHMLLVNVTASGAFFARRVRWSVSVMNALDWRYDVPVGDEFVPRTVPQDGRRFQAGLSFDY